MRFLGVKLGVRKCARRIHFILLRTKPLTKIWHISSRIYPSQSYDSDTGFDKHIANESLFTPKWSPNPNRSIKGNQSDDSDTGSDKVIANQISFTPKAASTRNSRIKQNQGHDSDI